MRKNLHFVSLPQFALFVVDEKLDEFVREQIRLSRELELPVLKHLSHMSDDELAGVSKITALEFLGYFVRNEASTLITLAIERWIADQLPQNIGRYQLSVHDITLLTFIRKKALLKFLPDFTTDLSKSLSIVDELDTFFLESDSAGFETFIQIMDEKINEHVHFIEKIAETSPGIVYVYDLQLNKEIYSNKKTKDVLGYDHDDFGDEGILTWEVLQHPEDLQATLDNLQKVTKLADGEISVFEHRLKVKNAGYLWMREYQSVFKRDENGNALQIIGLTMNIDNEKLLEQALLSREEQLLEAQTLADMGSFHWNIPEDTSTSTPQLKKILGLEADLQMREFMKRIHPFDRKRVEESLTKAIDESGIYDAEFRYLIPGEDKEQIIWSRGRVSYEDGKPVSMKGTIMDVTERHHMTQQLKRSEELYKQAQALTHIGNWTWDLQRNNITWTDELYRIFNLAPQSIEIKFDELLNYVHPRDKDLLVESVEHVDKIPQGNEYFPRIVLPDGTVKILSVKAEIIYDNNGRPFKLIGTAQDITQQKNSEKKLKENQNFIQKITDATPSIIAAYNINTGAYTYINRAFEKILGYPVSEVLEKGASFLASLIHPDDLLHIMSQNNEALANANKQTNGAGTNDLVVDFKYRLRHSNGTYRWFHTFGTVFDRNEKKEVEHVLNISIDITDRVAAEQKVVEQEHFIRHIADASPTVLFLYDLERNSIVYINNEIEPVLGYTPKEVLDLGDSVKNLLFHPDDKNKVAGHSESKPEGLPFKEFECRMKAKDGSWKCLLIREIGFRRDENESFTQVLCAALDISDRKKIEETLYHKTLELQQSNSSLEEFAYVASHDLKEPLRKITTFGDRLMAKEQNVLKEESQLYLDKIIESSQRMQRMIDDLLSISMISGEKTFEHFDLQIILDEVLQTLEFKIDDSKATITSDKLPVANIIPSQFRQLFQNLLSNSLKFSKENVAPEISIKCKTLSSARVEAYQLNKSNKYIELVFVDNGIGFDEKYADKIFSIFHRLHGRSEYEGTGIGLAICKKIVENHSGRIFANSTPGKGSTFTIIIPT